MVRYFILDIDGCVTIPFQSPDWTAITRIRDLQQQSKYDEHVPALSLCTGRPLPYTEAVAQWLGIRNTIIFESGGGFYHPITNELTWSPHFSDEIRRKSLELRKWFQDDVLSRFPGVMLEFAKKTDVGMVHTDINEIRKVYDIAVEKIADGYPEFEAHYTEVSVNIIVKACNKASGLQFFADEHGVTADEIAYIGDSSGDTMALEWAGAPYAPANAIEEVRKRADVMNGKATRGVLEAYQQIIARNMKNMSGNNVPAQHKQNTASEDQ
ncbi:HAD hydrolase family protein [Natronogracilivirga saccharolytica]|uniref:HAD hydrolase family protein n=1 Tax=Natronogracilivirga saccharolytica TaxID=2812953 RepID=A0A8J7UT34_9BACT|nr:HAD hydrolase family protein [Natronogracilivirga saccharolytica]MBP3192201.1 HAD hydrolase family protein [Natronogracilivirga saccharolytica]